LVCHHRYQEMLPKIGCDETGLAGMAREEPSGGGGTQEKPEKVSEMQS
jgi:hypothetical protein